MNSKGRGLRAIILTGALALGLALASLALWGASAAPQTGTAASIYCVNGTGTACDASLDGCFATIQPAIDAASSGDQLLIAGGIYTEPGGTVVAIAGKGLNIDGGYNPSCSQHDPDQYQTVLDGQALGTVVSVTNTGADLFMRWLTIQNGDGRGNCGIGGCGGGIYVLNSDFRLGHSIVRQNTGASPPSVVGDGGGIYIYNFYQPGHFVHIFDNQILSNTCSNLPSPGAQVGGGLNIYGSEILLNDNLFQGNLCIGHGDAGGAYLYDFATADLQNNQFLDNRAQRAAGGLMTLGGVISLSHNTFQNNHAGTPSSSGSGSAMWMVIPQGTADGNTFLNNTGGDAVRIRTSHGLTLTNNLIAANDASLIIVGVDPADLTLLANNTIADNGGSSGISLYYTATAELVNNIISGHDTGIYTDSTANLVTTTHNIFWNTYETFTPTTDIIADPLLTGDYHLQPGSPAIDAGLTLPWLAVDLAGDPRPLGAGYDIGAFEMDLAALKFRIYLPLILR